MTELRLPIRGNKGVQLDYYCSGQGGQLPPFYSHMIKSMSISVTDDNTPPQGNTLCMRPNLAN